MEERADLRDLCQKIGKDALFSLSRASKELFHTNFLGWVAEQRPDVFIAAFAQWLRPDPEQTQHRVRREWAHLDLVVELPGYAPLVVEAKVFSIPSDEQLARYSDLDGRHALPENTVRLLWTLDMPSWTCARFGETQREWTAVRLDAVAPGLESAARDSSFEHEIVRREAQLLRLLVELQAATALRPGGPFFVARADRKLLADFRLDLPVQKGRASQFRALVEQRHRASGIPFPSHELWAGASHGEAVTSALWSDEVGDGVGWQLQGGSWNLALLNQTNSGRDDASRKRRNQCAERNGAWFDFDLARELVGVSLGPERPTGGFNRYDPDFVYRSAKLPVEITTSTVVDLAETYGRRAADYRFQS